MNDLFQYIWKNKIWWILPAVLAIMISGLMILVSSATPISPFIYMLF